MFGFSLGAHLVGNAGEEYKGSNLKMIIGLDPAGPLFENDLYLTPTGYARLLLVNTLDEPTNRLDRTDARRVVSIHTSDSVGYNKRRGARKDLANLILHVRGRRGWRALNAHEFSIDVLTAILKRSDLKVDGYSIQRLFYDSHYDKTAAQERWISYKAFQ